MLSSMFEEKILQFSLYMRVAITHRVVGTVTYVDLEYQK